MDITKQFDNTQFTAGIGLPELSVALIQNPKKLGLKAVNSVHSVNYINVLPVSQFCSSKNSEQILYTTAISASHPTTTSIVTSQAVHLSKTILESGGGANCKHIPINHKQLRETPDSVPLSVESKSNAVRKTGIKRKRIILSPQKPIHLLKSGNTYRSLERLDEDKLRVVTNALQQIGDPTKNKRKSVYDGETKTRVRYRLIHPSDFEISESSEITIKDPELRKHEKNLSKNKTKPKVKQHPCTQTPNQKHKTENFKEEDSQVAQIDANETKKQIVIQPVKYRTKYKSVDKQVKNDAVEEKKASEEELHIQITKKTRSGRTVKMPLLHTKEETKEPKRRRHPVVDVLTCPRCRQKFHGACKLNRHYAIHPTHRPHTTHADLFLCFLELMQQTPEPERGHAFVRQLGDLVTRVRAMLPCMINNIDCNDATLCCISDDLARMLGMEPGKYNFSVTEAVRCMENKNEKCKHSMKNVNLPMSHEKPSRVWMTKHSEEIEMMEFEELEDCARVHSVDEWPRIKNKIKRCYPAKPVIDNVQAPCVNIDVVSTVPVSNEDLAKNLPQLQTANIWVLPAEPVICTAPVCEVRQPELLQIPVLDIPHDSMEINTKVEKEQSQVKTVSQAVILPAVGDDDANRFEKIIGNDASVLADVNEKDTGTESDRNLANNVQSSENINLDIYKMFPDLNSATPIQFRTEANRNTAVDLQRPNEDYYNINERSQTEERIQDKDYSAPLTRVTNAMNTCQGDKERLLPSSDHTRTYVGSSPVRPCDRLLSSEHAVTTQSMNDNGVVHESRHDYATSNSGHRGQNDCLLSGNPAVSRNDRLLSSGNIEMPQTDQLLCNMQTSQNDSLSNMCGSESNLDSSRISLPLLDQLGSDCLGSSLDLPLDLFPFNNPE